MLAFISLLLLCFLVVASANTEIVNFSASEAHDLDIPVGKDWPVLRRHDSHKQWILPAAPIDTPLELVCEPEVSSNSTAGFSPCPHELWVTLDLSHEDWKPYSKFTLRLSWPASFPSDISIRIYDPQALATRLLGSELPSGLHTPLTRRKYARIRAVDVGVLAPAATPSDVSPFKPLHVPFAVVLEPLYYGVLPASVVPVIMLIVLVSITAGLGVPKINKYLQGVVVQARREIANSRHTKVE